MMYQIDPNNTPEYDSDEEEVKKNHHHGEVKEGENPAREAESKSFRNVKDEGKCI